MEQIAAVTSTATAALLRVAAQRQNGPANNADPERTARARTSSSRVDASIRLLAAFRALRRDQLERFLFASEALSPASRRVAAFRVLGTLRGRGLVQAVVLPGAAATGGTTRAYVLTAAGQRVYAADDDGYPRRVRRPTTLLLDHAVTLADICLAFRDRAVEAGDIDLSWQTDWDIVTELGRTPVIPDAFVTLARFGWEIHGFIEADRATEREHAFANKVRRYVDLYRAARWQRVLGYWPVILTVTTSERRARFLSRLAFRVSSAEGGRPISHSFRSTSFEELARRGPYEDIWYSGEASERTQLITSHDEPEQRDPA